MRRQSRRSRSHNHSLNSRYRRYRLQSLVRNGLLVRIEQILWLLLFSY
jgi:hypothetical protein